MEYLISMFIDDELDLDDKISFVQSVRNHKSFSEETIELLNQEKIIRSDTVYETPAIHFKTGWEWKAFLLSLVRPAGLVSTGIAAAVLFMSFFMPMEKEDPQIHNRFVIYRPYVNQVEITGTFTNWKRIPMKKIGASGYWEISLRITKGEHRFTYILEGNNRVADPTILTRERDDFGGENSIIQVEGKV